LAEPTKEIKVFVCGAEQVEKVRQLFTSQNSSPAFFIKSGIKQCHGCSGAPAPESE
jgi:hypothetical protein